MSEATQDTGAILARLPRHSQIYHAIFLCYLSYFRSLFSFMSLFTLYYSFLIRVSNLAYFSLIPIIVSLIAALHSVPLPLHEGGRGVFTSYFRGECLFHETTCLSGLSSAESIQYFG